MSLNSSVDGISSEDLFEEEFSGPVHSLKNGLNIADLTSDRGAEFEIVPEADNFEAKRLFASEDDYFNRDDLFKQMNFECIENDDDSDEENEFRTPFQKIKAKMAPVSNDKGIYKQLIKQGSGPSLPSGSVVTVHYNGYFEYNDEPFDSTRLRNRPQMFQLGTGEVIRGLDIGVQTMKKGEIAKFLIQPEYAFGPRGCPPRIPPDATVLFEVELISVADPACRAAYEYEKLTPEERKNLPFQRVLDVCKGENQKANELFKNNEIRAALKKYKQAVRILSNRSLANESEEVEQQKVLLKLYLNVAICCIKEQNASQAESFSRRALQLDRNNTKGHYRLGVALRMQSRFREARKHLVLAQRREPGNTEIAKELIELDKKEEMERNLEKEFCRRMFESQLRTQNEDLTSNVKSPEKSPKSSE